MQNSFVEWNGMERNKAFTETSGGGGCLLSSTPSSRHEATGAAMGARDDELQGRHQGDGRPWRGREAKIPRGLMGKHRRAADVLRPPTSFLPSTRLSRSTTTS